MYWSEFVNTLYNNNIIDTEMAKKFHEIPSPDEFSFQGKRYGDCSTHKIELEIKKLPYQYTRYMIFHIQNPHWIEYHYKNQLFRSIEVIEHIVITAIMNNCEMFNINIQRSFEPMDLTNILKDEQL